MHLGAVRERWPRHIAGACTGAVDGRVFVCTRLRVYLFFCVRLPAALPASCPQWEPIAGLVVYCMGIQYEPRPMPKRSHGDPQMIRVATIRFIACGYSPMYHCEGVRNQPSSESQWESRLRCSTCDKRAARVSYTWHKWGQMSTGRATYLP